MRLHRLEITAFGPFGGTQRIDFDQLSAAGLFLLHGPTGAGKTSVLDAVCYALYGDVPGARQGSGLALRSDHAAPDTRTRIVLELTLAGRRLEITRYPEQLRPKRRGGGFTRDRAHSELRERAADGEWRGLSRSHQEIGEEIRQLLGMSREQFCQVVLLPQGDFARFLRAADTVRGELLGKLFGTGRFAAVEARLAELRRTGEARVRTGDERLLALGHRMRQAAADPALPETGVPDPATADEERQPLAPGDPGLAEAVLEWAALARSGARERRDIAGGAVRAAEQRCAAARRLAEEAGELARLQHRHQAARRRAQALREQRGEREETARLLERARAAGSVAPALELHREADRAQRAAAEAEQRLRAALPAEHREAGDGQLDSLERALREELGSLSAARRAEERVRTLTAELAALDREAEADEDALTEHTEWLRGWEEERRTLRRRVERAQEAATLAERLAAQAGTAAAQLSAARRRDTLTARADAAAAQALRAREDAAAAREHWLDLKDRRLRDIAAELAAGLRPGEPCAVCGGTEHPDPARPHDGRADRAAEEAALAAYERAEELRAAAEARLTPVREELAAATAGAGTAPVAELTALAAELEQSLEGARQAAAGLHPAREALDAAEREYERRRQAEQAARLRIAARTSRRENLEGERSALESEVARARGGAASVADRARLLERQAELLGRAAEAVRTAQAAADRLKTADARLAEAAYRAGFDTPEQAAGALLGDERQRLLRQRLDAWSGEEAAVAAELADPAVAGAAELPAAEPEAARRAADAADRALRAAAAREAEAVNRCAELDRLSAEALADARRLAPLREEHHRVAALAALAAGTSAQNERKMRLESYVLAARLEQVAAAAGARLQRMSSGRYTLVHSDARSGGRGRSGLGLHVIDAWTGRERDTATLSGGETFFASLALALGLADVVTDEAGGMRLDTLFIDEGFGSLDEETLDEVLDVLDSLRERDRAVGIVSHVADLRRRIPARLQVVKDRSGSAVRQRMAGTDG
ncbi:AAA family ATPase [Streptomyces orinoci]|uniref:Nuclease SbcCD subunit C n=1 Tax=Streptomyces orinoci TaxID=67339 RepID=A0ABV3JRQ7_STRON|nr:SMC family ATPase [Streptomyces orinoci]